MTIAKVHPCSCGGVPKARTYQAAEDLMEAVAECQQCGKTSDPIEHVWGGEDALLMAYEEWNLMRRLEEAKRRAKKAKGDNR